MTKNKKPGRVVVAKADELFVDLDGFGAATQARDQLAAFEASGWRFWRTAHFVLSRSPKHLHLIVKLQKRLPAMERLALQLILGDDPSRARYSYCRIKNKAPWPILLIRPVVVSAAVRRKSARAKNKARNARAVARFMCHLTRTDEKE